MIQNFPNAPLFGLIAGLLAIPACYIFLNLFTTKIKKYKTDIKPEKFDFKYTSCQIIIIFRGCMNIAILPEGLYFKVSTPFNLFFTYMGSGILIPWNNIRFEKANFLSHTFLVTPENFKIKVGKKVAEKILEHINKS